MTPSRAVRLLCASDPSFRYAEHKKVKSFYDADGLLQDDGAQALALVAVVGDHGAAGDVADELIALVYGHPRPHEPLAKFAVSFSPQKGDFIGREALAKQFAAFSRIMNRDFSDLTDLPRRILPKLNEPVPEPGGFGGLDVDLVADGLAGVAGLGHPDGAGGS